MNDLTPRSSQEIRRAGMVGVGSGISGLGLLILNGFSKGWGGAIVGGLVIMGGIGLMGSKDQGDRRLGGLVTAAGAVTAAAAVLKYIGPLRGLAHMGSFVLWGAGAALLGVGIYNIVKFVKGLKSRG